MKPYALCLFGLALALPGARGDSTLVGSIERIDPSVDELVAPDAQCEVIGSNYAWSEGPVWRKSGNYLLFSDIPNNTVYEWSRKRGIQVYLRPSGMAEGTAFGRELGCNALTIDSTDRLVMADQGDRCISRVDESSWEKDVLVDRFQGKRFNSPNDLVYRSNGDLYFTDPPYGLKGLNGDANKELKFNGVYRLDKQGKITLLTDALSFPNGIAFSPDEKVLYVQVSDPKNAVWMAYDVRPDGGIANGRIFFDANVLVAAKKQGLPDGMKVDIHGNIFGGGPGGVLILSPAGKHLGTIVTGQVTSNCAFGEDGSTLFMTANHFVMRIRLRTKGVGF